MTLFAKILAFLNLVVGLGILAWSVSVYVDRPMWFEQAPKSDGVDKGHDPVTFAQLKADIEDLAKQAAAAGADWGANLRALEAAEAERQDRQKLYAVRLKWAKDGNPDDGGNAFYEPVYRADGLLDLKAKGAPIKGSNNLPLKGADTLTKTYVADVARVVEMVDAIDKRRVEYAALGERIKDAENRLLAMGVIRNAVQDELFYLATFEINVYETRETVFRRKRQLVTRLGELGIVVK